VRGSCGWRRDGTDSVSLKLERASCRGTPPRGPSDEMQIVDTKPALAKAWEDGAPPSHLDNLAIAWLL
jgi:hypothetical protein